MRLSKLLCVLWNRGGAGCQRQCDRPADPECRDRPSGRAECRFARRLRTIGIGMVVASLIPFAIGMTVAATHWRIWFGRWISPPWRIPTMALGRFHPLATSSGNGRYLRTPAVPGGGFERPNPLIAGGPDPNAVIRIRDRLAAHLERLAYRARWCISPNLHHWRVFAPQTA